MNWLRDFIKNLFREGKIRTYDCSCGKTFEVVTNIYDKTDSGMGYCDCREEKVWIN